MMPRFNELARRLPLLKSRLTQDFKQQPDFQRLDQDSFSSLGGLKNRRFYTASIRAIGANITKIDVKKDALGSSIQHCTSENFGSHQIVQLLFPLSQEVGPLRVPFGVLSDAAPYLESALRAERESSSELQHTIEKFTADSFNTFMQCATKGSLGSEASAPLVEAVMGPAVFYGNTKLVQLCEEAVIEHPSLDLAVAVERCGHKVVWPDTVILSLAREIGKNVNQVTICNMSVNGHRGELCHYCLSATDKMKLGKLSGLTVTRIFEIFQQRQLILRSIYTWEF